MSGESDAVVRRRAAKFFEGFCWLCDEELDGEWCHGCLRRYRMRPGGFIEEAIPLPAWTRGQAGFSINGRELILLLADGSYYQVAYDGTLPDEDAWAIAVTTPPPSRAKVGA